MPAEASRPEPAGLFPGGTARDVVLVDGTVAGRRSRRGDGREPTGGVDAPTTPPIVASDPSEPSLCGRFDRPELESHPLAGSEREGDAASAAPGSQAPSCGAAARPLRRGRARRSRSGSSGRSRARSPRSTRPRSTPTSTRSSTRRTAGRCSPCCAATRAACSSTRRTSRRSCARRSSPSRISASSSTTASTCAACTRALAGRPPAGHRRGRLDDHAAVRQERVHPQRADARAEGSRGRARLAARAALEQGPDPHRVPEHDLLRARRVRHPAGGARVLQEEREGPDARRSPRSSRGFPSDPSLYDPARNPRSATLRRRHVLSMMLEQGKITRRQYKRARQGSAPRPGGHPASGHARAGAVLRQLREGRARRAYGAGRVFGGGLKVTTTIDLDLQLKARAAIEKILRNPDGPAAALVAIDPRDRRREGDVRRAELPPEPVQPRRAGEAAAGFLVQADRARDGDERGHLAGDRARVEAGLDRRRRPDLEGHELRPHVPRPREPRARDRLLGQLRVRAAHRPRRAQGDRLHAHSLGIRSPLAPYFSIGLGSGAVSPLDMARAYATIANDGRRVDGSVFGNRPRVVETVARVPSRAASTRTPRSRSRSWTRATRSCSPISSRTSYESAPASAPRSPAARSRARRGRPTTTATPGSSGTRRSSSSPCGSDTRTRSGRCSPSSTASPSRAERSPRMIWKAFVEKTDEDDDASFDSPPYLGGASTWVVRREGKWQLDNGYCRGSRLVAYFSGRGAGRGGRLQAERGLGPARRRDDEAGAEATLARSRSRRTSPTRPRKPGQLPGLVVEPGSALGRALGERHGHDLGLEGRARHAPELRRLEHRGRAARGRATQAPTPRQDRARAARARSSARAASPASRSRRGCASRSWSGTAHERRPGERVAPRPLDAARDADARRCDDVDDSPRAAASANGGALRSSPSCAPVIPSACVSLPGPGREQPRRRPSSPRAHASSPCVGSSARRSTAAPTPRRAQTMFAHQWMPYER